MLIGGFFTLLDTDFLDPLIQYRYETYNLLQYILFVLLGGLLAVLLLNFLTKKSNIGEIWTQGKQIYQNLTGTSDAEMDHLVKDTIGKMQLTIKNRIKQGVQNGMKKLQSSSKPSIAKVHLTTLTFPTPSQLYQEVTRPMTSQILATSVEPLGITEQPLTINAAEIDSPEGLEPWGTYQRRAIGLFFIMTFGMVGLNVMARIFHLQFVI